MIEWKGLFANTPYSSANNKTQDDAVVGMQDTIYVTGPGYGGYSANVRVHNASGAVVALIPVSGGGGTLSAPAPVRILDDSTTYSYSLEVVRGAVPSGDTDKIAIRIVGGASKRYPGQGSTLSNGSTSLAGPLRVAGDVEADSASFAGPVRAAGGVVANFTARPRGGTHTKVISAYQGSGLVTADRTVGAQIPAMGAFFGGRLTLCNATAAPITVGPVVVAVSATDANGGASLTWVPVLFGGASTIEIPASPSYASGGNVALSLVISDAFDILSVPRSDGTPYPLLLVRVYFPAGGSADTGAATETLAMTNAILPTGMRYMSARSAGNLATNPSATGITLSDSGTTYSLVPFSVEFHYAEPKISILGPGDSIQNGNVGTYPYASPLDRATFAANARLGVNRYVPCTISKSTQKHSISVLNAKAFLALSGPTPSVMRIPVFSPNDETPNFTVAGAGAMWRRVLELIDACVDAGMSYYLVGPAPTFNGELERTTALRALDATAKAFCEQASVPYVDVLAILEDPANPGKYLPAYDSSDHVHPSEAGIVAIAAAESVAIERF